MDNQIEAEGSGAVVPSTPLPGYNDLVTESFTKSLTSWPLFVLLAVSGMVMAVASYEIEYNTALGLEAVLGMTVLMFAAMFINIFVSVAGVKYYLQGGAGDIFVYLKEVLQSGWSYLWLISLSTLVMFSGFILFVIPGIILSTYLMFVLHVRAAESVTGMNALVRSTELVRENWWAVTLRMVAVTVAIIIAFFTAGFILGLIAGIAGATAATIETVSLWFIEPLFGALGTMIGLYALNALYRSLTAQKPAGEMAPSSSVRSWYIGLAVLTPFLMIAALTLLAFGIVNQFDFVDPEVQEQIMMEMEASA